jgi:hypothetical protein
MRLPVGRAAADGLAPKLNKATYNFAAAFEGDTGHGWNSKPNANRRRDMLKTSSMVQ